MSANFSRDLFQRAPLIGIVRGVPVDAMEPILQRYDQHGFTTLEITMNTTGAADMISTARENYRGKLNIGAGTVRSEAELDQALSAGAQFIVTPIINEKVCQICVREEVPFFPGAYTPTEIYHAWELGATAVKVFPAVHGGIDYIKAVQAPLDMIPLVPTGGVSASNLAHFLDTGVYGVGLGSALFPKQAIADANWSKLDDALQDMMNAYRQWKNSKQKDNG